MPVWSFIKAHTACDNNNNNNIIIINTIYTGLAPYDRNFRGAGGRSDQCSMKDWVNKKVLNLDLKIDRESLVVT